MGMAEKMEKNTTVCKLNMSQEYAHKKEGKGHSGLPMERGGPGLVCSDEEMMIQ